MSRALAAAVFYFAVAFAAGFVLGVVRTMLVVPMLGETAAIVAEIPVILMVSWIACGLAIRRSGVGASYDARATMGLAAFGLLMVAELALGWLGFGRTLEAQLASYSEPAGALGLAAQILFGAFPLFRR